MVLWAWSTLLHVSPCGRRLLSLHSSLISYDGELQSPGGVWALARCIFYLLRNQDELQQYATKSHKYLHKGGRNEPHEGLLVEVGLSCIRLWRTGHIYIQDTSKWPNMGREKHVQQQQYAFLI